MFYLTFLNVETKDETFASEYFSVTRLPIDTPERFCTTVVSIGRMLASGTNKTEKKNILWSLIHLLSGYIEILNPRLTSDQAFAKARDYFHDDHKVVLEQLDGTKGEWSALEQLATELEASVRTWADEQVMPGNASVTLRAVT
ncbi:MAG: hypothetical protein AAF438_16485 [Pseudomonadota bacterium]